MNPAHVLPLFRASLTMTVRARGVLYVFVYTPALMLMFALMRDLNWGLGDDRIDFVDFVFPGMAAFLAAHLFQDIVTAVAASYRSRGVLKRLAVTPVSAPLVVAVQMATYVLFGLLNGALVLAVGKLIGVNMTITDNLLWAVLLVGVVVLTALGISFAIAGFMPNPQSANAVSGALGLPIGFFSGATYPIEALPGVLPDLVPWVVPFAAPIKAIRGMILDGTAVTAYGTEVLIGLGWLTVAFVLAATGYRFNRE
jgi:ABC-2 type transport system permease protein